MSTEKKNQAEKIIQTVRNNPSRSMIIHYSRQNLNDNESGIATPRIVAILIKSLDGKESHCFSINHEAEKAKVALDNLADYYDQLEERLLRSFNSFVIDHNECSWLHWDMNEVHFGFEAIEHRYRVLAPNEGEDFKKIATTSRINISAIIKDIYGSDYASDSNLESLMKANYDGGVKDGHLSLEIEANSFKEHAFPKILESLTCKVNFLIEIIEKIHEQKLNLPKVVGKPKVKEDLSLIDIKSLTPMQLFKRFNWASWTILVGILAGAFSLGLWINSGVDEDAEEKYIREKLELKNELKEKNDIFNSKEKELNDFILKMKTANSSLSKSLKQKSDSLRLKLK